MKDIHQLLDLLHCPQCHGVPLSFEPDRLLHCSSCGANFPITNGRPVLLRSDNEVFCPLDYLDAGRSSPDVSIWNLGRFIPTPSIDLANKRVLALMGKMLEDLSSATVLVVGGGQQRQLLDERLGACGEVRVVHTDVDIAADVDIFCDGHDLPFADGVLDAVVVTAVLEHVLYPERVASEIHRVLKVGGLLYSDLPFMQQVHEGAYDFTRYTLSGHRRLFNGFSEIEAGMVAGPGVALVWSIENLFLAFTKTPVLRKVVKGLIRFGFAWLKYFDRMLERRPEAMDGASCTYFFGKKIAGKISDTDIIARYVGAKHLRHT